MKRVPRTVLAFALLLAACSEQSGDEATPESLKLIAHDSFASAAVEIGAFDGFTEDTGIEVEVIAAGDAGSLVNQAVLTRDNPLADVLFGIDDTFLSRGVDAGIFVEHRSEHIGDVPGGLVREDGLVTPINFGDVCLNYDKAWFEQTQITIPDDLDDLRATLYSMNMVVENPSTSSPGLAFMFATIDKFGEDGWLDYWADLKRGGVNVTPDWDAAYYGEFSRYGGASGLVVSYASSPPAEVIFADPPTDVAPTGVITDGCYRQVEYAGVLAGTEFPDSSGDLVDYMLSVEFQELAPLTWFVFPANRNAALPREFIDHAVIPENPARFDAEYIAENRDRWIDQWIEVMEG